MIINGNVVFPSFNKKIEVILFEEKKGNVWSRVYFTYNKGVCSITKKKWNIVVIGKGDSRKMIPFCMTREHRLDYANTLKLMLTMRSLDEEELIQKIRWHFKGEDEQKFFFFCAKNGIDYKLWA